MPSLCESYFCVGCSSLFSDSWTAQRILTCASKPSEAKPKWLYNFLQHSVCFQKITPVAEATANSAWLFRADWVEQSSCSCSHTFSLPQTSPLFKMDSVENLKWFWNTRQKLFFLSKPSFTIDARLVKLSVGEGGRLVVVSIVTTCQ